MRIRKSIIPPRTMSDILTNRISTIPLRPNISIGIGNIGGAGFNRKPSSESAQSEKYEVRPYRPEKRPMHNTPVSRKIQPAVGKVGGIKEAALDVFEESKNMLKVVGEFPGVNNDMDGLVIDITKENKLCLTSQLNPNQPYHFTVDLPKGFTNIEINYCEMNNGNLQEHIFALSTT